MIILLSDPRVAAVARGCRSAARVDLVLTADGPVLHEVDTVPGPTATSQVPAALAGPGILAVVPLRGHALTYLAGGPAIAALSAVLLLAWRAGTPPAPRALPPLVWLGTVSHGSSLRNDPLTRGRRPAWWRARERSAAPTPVGGPT
ncbi:peptidoglycan/LPS O-acetylase OafA/YrhL [Nocardioides zeae]|uniref:Peptidoglycan/LPS O-acetylase OafA/YrhL n=2 Tax=Nocardioides zeae TaxID=1457234 RepID=A0AAJ1TWD4_9ACTN|nr:hypothetical protein [Nocardioides zeae]MDQ1103516.1 peptidoglycan/LPS O-acetylase OafA/YrhL [Nocardioides zeae]MDR6172764.1 peptidoglycan/LPS O-acetylase OafA/YrhL [Nocardioides zeae]MDR6209774.1 peptidoglycan/LPS O-acetylase OafA/YrhL [Nocardioides zeae]